MAVNRTPDADPFTSEERQAILEDFRTHRFWCLALDTQIKCVSRPHPPFHAFAHTLWTDAG